MVIPDHPWTKATKDAAAVRIAMTVVEAGTRDGLLRELTQEADLDTDQPRVELTERIGLINSDLTLGADVTTVVPLLANEDLCSPGVKLHGAGFIVTPEKAKALGLNRRPGLERHIRHYRNGRDLTARPRGVMVIDLFGLTAEEVRSRFPEVYQYLLATVKPERNSNNRETYRANWWLFGEPRKELRPVLENLSRYIATPITQKHRFFQFIEGSILPDDALICTGSDDAYHLGVLSSHIHVVWALRTRGWLGVGNDARYLKTRCFNPFPFPLATTAQRDRIRRAAESLDAHRKERQALHPHVSLTDAYNVLVKVRADTTVGSLDEKDRTIFDAALVLVLRELHDELDAAVADAYGWPADLGEEDLLMRLVALNKSRAAEEDRGAIHWLRPDFQVPRLGTLAQMIGEQIEANLGRQAKATGKASFPSDDMAQTAAVMTALMEAAGPLNAVAIASEFRKGRHLEERVGAVLAALSRLGFLTTADGRYFYVLRRAA